MRERLARWAARGAHVLVVEVPGWGETRMSAERALTLRGWRVAACPADADVLLLCGVPGRDLGPVVERVWAQMPGPRVRVTVTGPSEVAASLDEAATALLDDRRQREHAASRTSPPDGSGEDRPADDDEMDDGGMEMPMPGGVPLAGGGPDRDGLDLDVLHVPLGPVLPHWPAGLVLRCALQGDVITHVEVELLVDAQPPAPVLQGPRRAGADDTRRRRAVRRCDSAARLLAVAGWDHASTAARSVRDELLTGAPLEQCAHDLDRLTRLIHRSRLLRWSLRGLGTIAQRDLTPESGRGAAVSASGDVVSRIDRWLQDARSAVGGDEALGVGQAADPLENQRMLLRLLPELVTGRDLAAARLVVASLDPDTAALAGTSEPARG